MLTLDYALNDHRKLTKFSKQVNIHQLPILNSILTRTKDYKKKIFYTELEILFNSNQLHNELTLGKIKFRTRKIIWF